MDKTTRGRILITGGAGGVGAILARRYQNEGYTVRLFDLPTPANKKAVAGMSGMELEWGDITDPNRIREAMNGVNHVAHLAALLPPATESNPQLAHRVNVEGTRNVVDAANAESEHAGKPVSIRYTSSVTVYGVTNHLKAPLPADQPVNPSCVYSETKVKSEEVVRNSGLPWTIFRFAAAVYLTIRKGGFQQMRIIPPENRLEFVHIYDITDAFINSMDNPEVIGKTFVLGGGPRCRMIYKDQIGKTFDFMGFPHPDWRKFSKEPFNLDWYDTAEAQRVLRFQNRTFDDYLVDFRKSLGWKYPAMRYAAGPLLKLFRIHL